MYSGTQIEGFGVIEKWRRAKQKEVALLAQLSRDLQVDPPEWIKTQAALWKESRDDSDFAKEREVVRDFIHLLNSTLEGAIAAQGV